jgi:phosphoglycolate phosphatase
MTLSGRHDVYEVILFDLDGTLTDSQVGIVNSVQYALAKMDIAIADPRQLANFLGPPLHESFREFYGFDAERTRRAVDFYRERYTRLGMFENKVYPGIAQLLAELTRRGRRLFVATSKAEVYARRIVAHFQLDHYFEAIVGSNLEGTRSVKADIIAAVIAGYGLEQLRGQMVMVGDRKHDLLGAQANHIAAIGVTYGYGTMEEISRFDPNALAGSVAELAGILIPK